jgi:prepilin-type N-terminal cleavage/methylation domain-containing protein
MYMNRKCLARLPNRKDVWMRPVPHQLRAGFTLVEILVVISILAILVVMTVSSLNFVLSDDLTRSTSRQVQSYLAGARDRAIYAKEPRGVRFLLDANNPNIVTSLVYVAPSPNWDEGVIRLERIDETGSSGSPSGPDGIPDSPEIVNVRGGGTGWKTLYAQGQLLEGARIKIPGDESGSWYTINLAQSFGFNGTPTPGPLDPDNEVVPNVLRLSAPYRDPGTAPDTEVIAFSLGSGPSTYLLELPPVVLSGEEPALLPSGAGIDLTRSFLPVSWIAAGQSSQLDILFSPRGSVIGDEAAAGKIHFTIDTIPNMESTWLPGTDYEEGDRVQVPPVSGYGSVTVNSINFNPDMRFFPYDRAYVCTSPGQSGSNPKVFLYGKPVVPWTYPAGDARTEGATISEGGVTWKVELNTSAVLLSLFTRTGKVQANKLYYDQPETTYFTPGGLDPFKYAETGATTK